MAPHKKELLAAASVIIVLSAIALGFAFIIHEPSKTIGSKAPSNSNSGQSPSPTAPATTTTNSPSPCATETPTSTPTPTKTASDDLELTISFEKTVYNIGEPVNVTLTITNVSQQTVDFTSTGMNFDFIVYNDTNNLVYQWSIGQAFPAIAMIQPLAPGENVTATYVWPQTVKTSMTSTENVQVAPGTYYIVGESNQIYGLQTTPMQINILNQ